MRTPRVTKAALKRDAKFNAAVDAYMKSLGARSERWGLGSELDHYVQTQFGELRVSAHGTWIACRFDDVKAAVGGLERLGLSDCNPYSGKWNWHFGGEEREQAFAAFKRDLARIL